MDLLKKAVTVKGKAIYNVVTLFSWLLVMGQQRSVDIADVFQFELSPVPPALIDEYGCLRKGDKAVLVKSFSVSVTTPYAPDMVLVDAGQLLYHVVWPVSETTGDLAASFGTRLANYPPVSKKIILFDRYDQEALSAKDHERTRRGRAKQVHLTPNTLLPCREVILHNSKNKNLLNNILCSYPLPHNIQLVNMLDCVVTHDEADVTLCSYMLKAVAAGAQTIRILSDDTDVFVLLEYWTSRMRVVAKIQMEKWNGDILDINETVQWLGPQKVQSTSRYPCTIRLRYSVIPLWKRKKVSAQAHRDRYTRSRSSARTTWHDPRSARGDSIHILLTPLRTEGMYNNE